MLRKWSYGINRVYGIMSMGLELCGKFKISGKRMPLFFFNGNMGKTSIAKSRKQKEQHLQNCQLKTLIRIWKKLSGNKIVHEFVNNKKNKRKKAKKINNKINNNKILRIKTESFKEGM